MAAEVKSRTFLHDVAFLKKHTDVVVLASGDRQIAVVPEYQGRVMTSTTSAKQGLSFGWLNYELIETGILSEAEEKGQPEAHSHVFGGEDRFS